MKLALSAAALAVIGLVVLGVFGHPAPRPNYYWRE
jgi:hypothetical protein